MPLSPPTNTDTSVVLPEFRRFLNNLIRNFFKAREYTTSQARVFIPSRATAKTLVQAGHVTPPNLPKSGRFLISVLYAIKGGVAKYNMSLSCMSEPLEMPKRNK